MSSATLSRVHGLQDLLDRCQRRIRMYALLRGIAETLCVAIGCLLLSAVIDYFVILPSYARLGLLLSTVVVTSFVAIKRLIVPVTSSAPNDELGAAMDLKFPELQESLATLISFDGPSVSSGEAGSAIMRERLTRYVQQQIGSIEPARVVESRSAFNRTGLAAVAVILLMIPMVLWPAGSRLLLQRFFMPLANLATPTDLYFEVTNGNRVISIGSDAELLAIPHWHSGKPGILPEEVIVEIRSESGAEDHIPMAYDEAKTEFQSVLPSVQSSFKYRVRGGRAVTEWFEIQVATPPSIVKAELIETPPVYTGRPVESFDGIVGDIHVFERSQIEVRLSFNKPVETVQFRWKNWKSIESESSAAKPLTDAEAAKLGAEELARAAAQPGAVEHSEPTLTPEFTLDRTSCVFRFDATGSGAFEFVVSDKLGLTNPADPSRRLITSTDKPPKLIVKGLRDDLEVRPDDVVALHCEVTDDIGVGLLELHFQKNADAVRIEPFADLERGSRNAIHEFSVALKSLQANVGDTVTFRVRAADERPLPEPQVVWKGPWTIRITADAEPLGKKPLREDDQKLVDALRKMEEELQKDSQKSNELKNELWKNWNEPTQQQVKDLSEKEQTQGRDLQKLAEQVAEHPLMAKQSEKLTELARQVREEVPDKLSQAAAEDRDPASQKLQQAAQDLNKVREELHKVTDEIQRIAEVEQELAELNRLALEAQQLARDSEKLDAERQSGKPEEGQSEQDRQKQLDERQTALQQEQKNLSDDLKSLLQRRQELLQAAREAQLNEAAQVAKETRELAQQQQQLAEGVRDEANDAARDAQELANQLQQARNEADQLANQIQQQDNNVKRPELQPLDAAIQDVRQGNLATPKEKIDQAQDNLEQAGDAIKKPLDPAPADPANPPDPVAAREADRKLAEQNQKRAELGAKADEAVSKLEKLEERLNEMQSELAANETAKSDTPAKPPAPSNAENPSAGTQQNQNSADQAGKQQPSEQAPSEQNPAGNQTAQQDGDKKPNNPQAPQKPGLDLLKQLQQMTESSEELAQTMKADATAPEASRQHAQHAAERANEAMRHANAGQFSRAAERMRQSANESSHSAEHLQQEAQQDHRNQMQQQRDGFNRMSDLFQQLNDNDAAQVGAQQSAQQDVAQSAQQMAEPLRELSDRLNNEALGMQHLSKPLEEAAAASEQAALHGEQASDQLDQAQLQQAGQTAQEAANQLNRAAQLAEQAAQGHRDPNNVLPAEVGESVNDAMQSLRKAGELMNQEAADRASQMAAQQNQQAENGQQPQDGSQPRQNPQDGQQPTGEGQPGSEPAPNGQPGQGNQPASAAQPNGQSQQSGEQGKPGQAQPGQKSSSSGSKSARQMAQAAKALQQAARQVVPGQFSPGQLNPDAGNADPQGNGNSEKFDGRNPNATTKQGRKRWGTLHDELEEDATDYSRDKIDPEYAEFVRRFRRDMARSGKDTPAENAKPK